MGALIQSKGLSLSLSLFRSFTPSLSPPVQHYVHFRHVHESWLCERQELSGWREARDGERDGGKEAEKEEEGGGRREGGGGGAADMRSLCEGPIQTGRRET